MDIALWITQALLAFMFGMAGMMKAFQPIEKLAEKMEWAEKFPTGLTRFIGLAEVLGAVGLILPWLLDVMPILTPVSAVGLAVIMVLAVFYHLPKREYKEVGMNVALMALALFVAVGRFGML